MQKFKEELFYNSYGQAIQHECLSDSDKVLLDDYIKTNLGVIDNVEDFFILVKNVLKTDITLKSLQTAEEIDVAFNKLGLLNQEAVIVIWKFPIDIDKFKLSYLIKYWEDIWYGESDDAICLFFPESNRMILITHYDIIYY